MIRQCCVCRVNGSAVAMEPTDLPGDWRCRDWVGCRRRVRGKVQSAQLAAELDDSARRTAEARRLTKEVTELGQTIRDLRRKR